MVIALATLKFKCRITVKIAILTALHQPCSKKWSRIFAISFKGHVCYSSWDLGRKGDIISEESDNNERQIVSE